MRCMSFALESSKRKEGIYSILDLLKYNFYLPFFFFGPVMTFDQFHTQPRPPRFPLSQACFASLVSQDYVNGTDQEEIRTGVDQCIQKFLDVARQTECFFLQKRLQLSVQKPEQVIKEDVSELRNELQRKEALIQKHLGKLRHWQQVLEDISVQHKKPAEMPQGPLAYLEQASANIPAPMKQT
ncbi:mediator of RNA polymerase II transcription subunit 28 [Athene cunicularia]|nr:mediator of RNA polymerase II transcription subunit 28 [Athene cunicularia]